MEKKNVVLAIVPEEYAQASKQKMELAHFAYRISSRGRLLRSNIHQNIRGGLLGLSDAGVGDTAFPPSLLCTDILNEIAMRSYRGVIADLEGPVTEPMIAFATELDRQLALRSIPLYVNQQYAAVAKKGIVLVSSEITGGSLSTYLSELAESYGIERIALEVMPMFMDFLLPSPTGEGERLSVSELNALMERMSPMPFFSRELCAKYFTYMAADRKAHFVLFDDGYTIMAKLKTAAGCGVGRAFMLYSEVKDMLPDIFEE